MGQAKQYLPLHIYFLLRKGKTLLNEYKVLKRPVPINELFPGQIKDIYGIALNSQIFRASFATTKKFEVISLNYEI